MAEVRRATVSWDGDLATGTGTASSGTSGTFRDLPVSWASRTEAPAGRTSPEELLAAAHASCFAMALSGGLVRGGMRPQHLDVTADVTFAKVGDAWSVVSSHITVRGRVPGASDDAFQTAADAAKEGCPISRALKGNVELSVEATLQP